MIIFISFIISTHAYFFSYMTFDNYGWGSVIPVIDTSLSVLAFVNSLCGALSAPYLELPLIMFYHFCFSASVLFTFVTCISFNDGYQYLLDNIQGPPRSFLHVTTDVKPRSSFCSHKLLLCYLLHFHYSSHTAKMVIIIRTKAPFISHPEPRHLA